ncbi:MAG TPA: sugar ABC transporter permease [Bacillales bacterium]|nr:sugar ABC transporter permease [Bacillales bacterium]
MKQVKHHVVIYLFLLPAVALFAIFSVYPILYSFIMSFTNWPIMGDVHFVGFQNYSNVLHDPVILTSFKNVLLYLFIAVPLQLVLGLLVAIGLDRPMPGRTALRLIYYVPVITSWVVVTYMFQYLFNTQYGLVNWLLESLHIINNPVAWLADPTKAIVIAAVIQIWKGIGWAMMIFLAALQSVSDTLYEAAAIDGAGRWRRFWSITLPSIRGQMFFVSVLLVMGAFQVFIQIYILTAGGPANETQVPNVRMYEEAFSQLHFGYAGALSWLMALLIIVITLIQFSVFKPRSMSMEER